MASENKNNKKNVSLGKPMVNGCVWRAPAGTSLPSNATSALADAFECVGYISEDGVTNATDTDNTEVNDMGGVKVVNEISSYGESFQFAMLEANETSMKVRYGEANVTTNGDSMTIDHRMPAGESAVFVFEILLTGNKVKRIVVPDGTPSEFGDTQYSAGDAIMYDVTIGANPSELIGGATSREYIAPIPTTHTTPSGE